MKNSIETECWKPIPGYENYEASDLGRVRSLNYRGNTGKTKVLRPGVTTGYYRVVLCKNGKTKHFFVQRLVVEAFHGPIPPGMVVNHLNEIKTDNRLQNLEICTVTENNNWGTRNERAAASLKGKKFSAEHRAKLSAALKARHQREKNQE